MTEPQGGQPQADIGLLRMRLRLALLAVGIVPLAVASAVLFALSPGEMPIQLLTLIPIIGLILLPIVMWLPRHILRTTEALDRSRAELSSAL